MTTVAPLFERFFVEFQRVENPLGFNAWGVLVDQIALATTSRRETLVGRSSCGSLSSARRTPRSGPVISIIFALDRAGQLMIEEGDELVLGIVFPKMTPEQPPEEVIKQTGDQMVNFLLPAFMAISFMHLQERRDHRGRPAQRNRVVGEERGQPLVSYHVLEIGPMREALNGDGELQGKGLKHALHVCRGHFKTFDEEAPLFGRTTGTFWWADQVRGSAKEGEIVKDYEVRVPGVEFGRPDKPADEEPELTQVERTGPDPDGRVGASPPTTGPRTSWPLR